MISYSVMSVSQDRMNSYDQLFSHECVLTFLYTFLPPGKFFMLFYRECSGSVVECWTHDRGDVGSSLTGATALYP